MSDLIERLRCKGAKRPPCPCPSCEAADEIERLEKSQREYRKTITGLEAEIARKDEVIRCLIDRFWDDGSLFISKALEQNGFIQNEFTTQDQDND